MTIVHIHIERTGGVSLQNLYEKKYLNSNILWYSVRDGLFAPLSIKTASYTKGWQLKLYYFICEKLPTIRKLMLIIREMKRKRQNVPVEKLGNAKVIIGHFSASDMLPYLSADKNKYRSVIREPIDRMWSHYNYWIDHTGNVGQRVVPTYKKAIKFEEFALLPELINYQSRALGEDLSIYELIGVTDYLKDFAIEAGLLNKSDQMLKINNFSNKIPDLDKNFIELFKKLHNKDYELYNKIRNNWKDTKLYKNSF